MGTVKKNLLTTTLQYYLGFSLIVILVAAPVFYLLTVRLFRHEADEVLFLHKSEFIEKKSRDLTFAEIPLWNRHSMDVIILGDSLTGLKRDSLADFSIVDHVHHEEVPYRVLYAPIRIESKKAVLIMKVSLIESDALIRNIRRVFITIILFLLGGLFLITRILSARLWKPFYTTISALEGFELDKNIVPALAETNIQEFDRLNKSATRLLEKNLLVFKSQKEFVENAAHELQTPIASFLAKLDVMVQEIPITQGLGESLTELHHSAARIIRLNKNLLLLSKIENDQYASFEKVLVSSVVEKQSAFIREQFEESKGSFSIRIAESLIIPANLTLLEVAIGNLLLNALRHNIRGGSIAVVLENKVLTVSNSGNLEISEPENLFKRFSKSGTGGGSGLGLAIVKKVADQHRWKVSYSFSGDMHSFFLQF